MYNFYFLKFKFFHIIIFMHTQQKNKKQIKTNVIYIYIYILKQFSWGCFLYKICTKHIGIWKPNPKDADLLNVFFMTLHFINSHRAESWRLSGQNDQAEVKHKSRTVEQPQAAELSLNKVSITARPTGSPYPSQPAWPRPLRCPPPFGPCRCMCQHDWAVRSLSTGHQSSLST